MEKFQEQLRGLSEQFNKLQQGNTHSDVRLFSGRGSLTLFLELQEAILSRQQLDTQKQENSKVKNVSQSTHPSVAVVVAFCFESATVYLGRQMLRFKCSSQEFENLKEGEIIYKLVGPVLLKQEKFEAKGTVEGRLEYISKELCVSSAHPSPRDFFFFQCLTSLSVNG
jgi:chaperonin cofactor prefoldin